MLKVSAFKNVIQVKCVLFVFIKKKIQNIKVNEEVLNFSYFLSDKFVYYF